MNKILKYSIVLVLTVMMSICSVFPCFAAMEHGKITVVLEGKDTNDLDGLTVQICQVAGLNNAGYYPTKEFEDSGISISGILNHPDAMTANTIASHIKSNQSEVLSAKTKNGKATFEELNLGIWVVYAEEDSNYTFHPYIVFLPYESESKLHYEVLSVPKVEEGNLNETTISVMKKWDDNNNAPKKRPDSITVELLNGGKIVQTIELSRENGWMYTFSELSKEGEYSVREKAVANYKTSYSGDAANGFMITNTYVGGKLPQTGQYWWPIAILAIAGVGFVVLGIYEIGVKKHEKKK